jgi:hypothetical protein
VKKILMLSLSLFALMFGGCTNDDLNMNQLFTPYAQGASWYNQGYYDRAHSVWKNALHKGDCDVQYALGSLYAQGKGAPRDWSKVIPLWTDAANQGHRRAQIGLAAAYVWGEEPSSLCKEGCGVKRDLVSAAVWMMLAQKSLGDAKDRDFDQLKAQLEPLLSQADKDTAQARAEKWQPSPKLCQPRNLI